jgi:hypothetical protein
MKAYNTKHPKIVGLCIVSMLVTGMALAGNAAAAPLWLLCLEGSNANNTKYEDNQCTKAASTGKWESVALGTKSDTARILALSLRVEDTKGELGSKLKFSCPRVGGIGLIEGRNLLLVREIKVANPASECTAEGGVLKECKTSKLEKVEAVHLPWVLEAYEEKAGKFISRLQPSGEGKGAPGWTFKCAGVEDTCTGEGEARGANKVGEGVLLVFNEFLKTRPGSCSVGGAKAGKVEGFFAVLLSNGNGLSARAGEEKRGSKVTPSPVSKDFEGFLVGEASPPTVTITYSVSGEAWKPTGEYNIVLTRGEAEGKPFTVKEGVTKPCNKEIPVGGSCEIIVEFNPLQREEYRGTVEAVPNAKLVVVEGVGE